MLQTTVHTLYIQATGSLDAENPIVIQGTENKGRYGSAIVNLGDINNDGFEGVCGHIRVSLVPRPFTSIRSPHANECMRRGYTSW